MRTEPSILHVDMDAFFASVEQRDKPSLRGKPVIVGGVGPRGVVATASYEARVHGVRSATPMAHARRLCPRAAVLAGRFPAYRATSAVVMDTLHELSPAVEAISLDEAFVDLTAPGAVQAGAPVGVADVTATVERLRAEIRFRTGLAASVGAGTSKLVAKIASELAKPDGLLVVAPGTERALLDPLPVGRLWGVGPATVAKLAAAGVRTVAEAAGCDEAELVALLGRAAGASLFRLARADDARPVVAEREAKSVSVEETFDHDVADRVRLHHELDALADRVARRLADARLSGRTVNVKVRGHDFTTVSRAQTLATATAESTVIRRTARGLLDQLDLTGGVRLLGVGVAGLAAYTQLEINVAEADAWDGEPDAPLGEVVDVAPRSRAWVPGQDVVHATYGRGWVWGAGAGRVTVRFETRESGPGPVRTFDVADPALHAADPEPLDR